MIIKILGAGFILAGCSGLGISLAASYKKEVAALKDFLNILDLAECQLQYKNQCLPDLLKDISVNKSPVSMFFKTLSEELESQVQPSVPHCVPIALKKHPNIPTSTKILIEKFGQTLGSFDINGQLLEIQAIRTEANGIYEQLKEQQSDKIKNYKTLSVCAGAAIVILFI